MDDLVESMDAISPNLPECDLWNLNARLNGWCVLDTVEITVNWPRISYVHFVYQSSIGNHLFDILS